MGQLRQIRATQHTMHAGCFRVSLMLRTLTWTTGSLTCAQMLMHEIAHGVVRTHVRESALKVDTGGKKSLSALENWICVSGVPVRLSTNWATSSPFLFWWLVFRPDVAFCDWLGFDYQESLFACFISHFWLSSDKIRRAVCSRKTDISERSLFYGLALLLYCFLRLMSRENLCY